MKHPVRELVLLAALTAVLEAAKAMLSALPNIELVSLLLIVYTLVFGWKRTLAVSYAFTAVQTLIYGFGLWTMDYLYVWQILIGLTWLLRKADKAWVYAVLSGFFGLAFGALCALVTAAVGGWQMAVSWWISGIPYDIVHCLGNLVICLLLYKPLRRGLEKAAAVFRISV